MVWQLREYKLITVGKIPQTQSERPASSGNGSTPETDIVSVLKDSERLWKCSKVKEAKETAAKIISDPRVSCTVVGNVMNYWISWQKWNIKLMSVL